jgi:hypothetical protein
MPSNKKISAQNFYMPQDQKSPSPEPSNEKVHMPTDLLLPNSFQRGFDVRNKSTKDHSRENLEASKIQNPRNSKKIQPDEITPTVRSSRVSNTEDDNWDFPIKKKWKMIT